MLAFVRSGNIRQKGQETKFVSDIYLLDMESGSLINLTDSEMIERAPQWSPDGTQLVYNATDMGEHFHRVYVQPADGSYPPRLIVDGIVAWQPRWSADAQSIIFSGEVNDHQDLYMVGINDANLIQLTQTDGIDETGPDWSPDGSKILFTRRTGRRTTDHEAIVVVSADCVSVLESCINAQVLGLGRDGRWSPDGQKIAFSADSKSNPGSQIYIMNADGSGVQQVTDEGFGGMATVPTWSPDGRQIVYHHARPAEKAGLFVINVDGSGAHAITDSPFPLYDDFPAWRPG